MPLRTALRETGFQVDKIEKYAKKTVITVYRHGQTGEIRAFPALKAAANSFPAVEREENSK